ncbi:MAG TPA: phosphoribosyltransferase family protein [Actinomycetota bacterium]|nr:phosphoribosyltransferase family protein [Actinomycetota bacterium]
MRFADRTDAGERLAPLVAAAVGGPAVVLGIPRGGVVVAVPVARLLGAPLDVIVPRKLGAPAQPELGIGAVAPGVCILDDDLIARLHVSRDYLDAEIARQRAEIVRRTERYRGGRAPLDLGAVAAVLVDDGVATGATAFAAIASARAAGAAHVIFAAPVAPPETAARLGEAADRAVVLTTPPWFAAVGEWYERFDQVSDEEVQAALADAT